MHKKKPKKKTLSARRDYTVSQRAQEMRSDKIYLVTSCAACAAPLSNKVLQCKRCKTRYAKTLERYGPSHQVTLQTAEHLSQSLFYTSKLAEAKDFLLESIPKAQASLGDDKFYTLRLRSTYGKVLRKLGSVGEAEATLTDILRRGRRTLGDSHPFVQDVAHELDELRTGRSDSSEQAALTALAFVAALAFLAGRRYLRR